MAIKRSSKSKYIYWSLMLIVIVVFFLKIIVGLDPDFGWHYKMGELILSSGIPPSDPFSYTMPSFPFIDHEWLTNIFFFAGENVIGRPGMSLVFAGFALLAVVLPMRFVAVGTDKPESFLFLLVSSALLPFLGVRPQIVSWLLLALLVSVLFSKKLWRKYRLLFPFFLVLWTNLHGSFPLGLFIVMIFVGVGWLEKRRVNIVELALLAFAVLATFVNPYGMRVWEEVWRQFGDTSLRWNIAEWKPTLFVFNLPLIGYSVVSVMLIVKFRKRFPLAAVLLYAVLLVQGILTLRHIPLWVIFSLPVTIACFEYFRKSLPKKRLVQNRYKKFMEFAYYLSLAIFVLSGIIGLKAAASYGEDVYYPQEVVGHLVAQQPEGNIFSRYGWGGYLIWKMPDVKVFVDGRMPSWRWDNHPKDESSSAFDDYKDILNGEVDYKKSFEKYNINTVLWSAKRQPGLFDELVRALARMTNNDDKSFDLVETLEEDGWEKTYDDGVAVVYVKEMLGNRPGGSL